MDKLIGPIALKLPESSIANHADLMLCYSRLESTSAQVDSEKILSLLETSCRDKLVVKDYFNALNATRILFSLAQHKNKALCPGLHLDVGSCLLQRGSLMASWSVHH